MFREFLRSALYSSSRPFSSRATRDSSFYAEYEFVASLARGKTQKFFYLVYHKTEGVDRSEAELPIAAAAKFLIESSSCSMPAARRWRWRGPGLPPYSKEAFKKVAGGGRPSREGTSHGTGSSPPDFTLGICFRLDIG